VDVNYCVRRLNALNDFCPVNGEHNLQAWINMCYNAKICSLI